MTAATMSLLHDRLAAVLRGEPVAWASLESTPEHLLETIRDEGVLGLACQSLRRGGATDWPSEVLDAVAAEARAAAATELARGREVTRVLAALAERRLLPILLKGTALAYSRYRSPALRPREDTDLLIRETEADAARQVMGELGYRAPAYDEQLHGQVPLVRTDDLAVQHAFDFHWRLSTQAAFAELLGYDEIASESVAVPALGPAARAACDVHALLLACVHPAMHHRNEERLIWVHDVHLLAGRLRERELDRFAELAVARGVARICAQELGRACDRFGTVLPPGLLERLGAASGEATAVYLGRGRSWRDELVSNVGALGSWRGRLGLLRRVAFPGPAYMMRSYDVEGAIGAVLLPLLYAHRAVRGVWRVLSGRK